MLVWLTDWQLAEEHALIRVGDVVDWTLCEADRVWVARLFADRLSVEWQLDTYGDAADRLTRRVRGEVIAARSARCRQVTTEEGRVPATGEARLLPVEDTSGSWMQSGPWAAESETRQSAGELFSMFGSFASAIEDDLDHLYGYVLTVKVSDDDTVNRSTSLRD